MVISRILIANQIIDDPLLIELNRYFTVMSTINTVPCFVRVRPEYGTISEAINALVARGYRRAKGADTGYTYVALRSALSSFIGICPRVFRCMLHWRQKY